MSEEFTTHLRATLIKLLHAAKCKTSVNSLINEIQKQKEKFPKKYVHGILADIAKVDRLADKIHKELQPAASRDDFTAAQYLLKFLTEYDKMKHIRKAGNRPNIGTITEDDEMQKSISGNSGGGASSTSTVTVQSQIASNKSAQSDANGNVAAVTKVNVKDVCKKVLESVQKVQPNVSSTSISAAPSHTSQTLIQQQSTADIDTQNNNNNNNNNIPLPQCGDRIHSKLYFSKSIMDVLPSQAIPSNCVARSVNDQEQLLIADLLGAFIGLPGDFITPQFNDQQTLVSFKISDQIHVSLRNIADDILPMANYYSVVQQFAQWSSHVNNQIMQALSEVLQHILNDYRVSVTQLEREYARNTLNLHKLMYLIRPNMQTLNILAELVGKVVKSNLHGGSILTLLFDEITLQTGDSMAQKMLIELTERASIPYIEMLERWILKGVIIDPYNQFFIIDNRDKLGNQNPMHMDDYHSARYWEHQYTIQTDRIPRFLEHDADIILRTGKYLNVIRQYGKQIAAPTAQSKLKFLATQQHHSMFIKQAYHNASKTLLELFLNENNLMGHISSVKRYFLLQQGDLITQFMDASEEELSKHVDKVTPVRLDNLLQLIVRLSSAKNDPCLEYLHCDLFTMDLVKKMSIIHENGNDLNGNQSVFDALANDANDASSLDLTGLECFTFRYSVDWPISIVLNQWVMSQYQMLFRLLFYCKHVDRQLCKHWIQSMEFCKSNDKIARDQWRKAFALRQRMLNAIQHLEYYMMIEVIEPNWHNFTEKMKRVNTIDDVITIHQDFLHACVQNCMLQHPNLLKSIMKICHVCLNFCKILRNEPSKIESIENEFNDLMIGFIGALGEQSSDSSSTAKFVSLVCRLNFNSFYN